MAELRTHKIVSTLPGTLEANAIYYVRVGTGFDIYVTNNNGTIISYPLNITKGIIAGHPGKLTPNLVIGGGVIAPYSFTINIGDLIARAKVAATSSTVLTILRDGTSIGTITFGAGATVGNFSINSLAITKDQRIDIVAPAVADATLADIAIRMTA